MRRTPAGLAAPATPLRRVVGGAEIGLPDSVHQVVDDVDRPRLPKPSAPIRVLRVQRDDGDIIEPAVSASREIARGGDDSWPWDSSSETSREPT